MKKEENRIIKEYGTVEDGSKNIVCTATIECSYVYNAHENCWFPHYEIVGDGDESTKTKVFLLNLIKSRAEKLNDQSYDYIYALANERFYRHVRYPKNKEVNNLEQDVENFKADKRLKEIFGD